MTVVQDPIVVVAYDPHWPAAFEAEHARISAAIAAEGAVVEHIGSTSVPGLAAKPVIDIMIGLQSLSEAPRWIAGLEALGYEYVPAFEAAMPERRYFRRFVNGARTHQIHMVEAGSEFWVRHLAFRDYLRAHRVKANAYGMLKLDLAERFRDDREGYMDGKDAFIRQTQAKALVWYKSRP